MVEPFVGEVRAFGFNFAPRNWAACDGQLLPISQNTALFSLLGTRFGGDGKSSFGLPDLAGRAPMMWGRGPGLTDRQLGESGGEETVTLTEAQIPAHTHQPQATSTLARGTSPEDSSLGTVSGAEIYGQDPDGSMAPEAVAASGGGMPHSNMQPYLGVQFCIALQGLFPPRQ